jgi:hypothetical protein
MQGDGDGAEEGLTTMPLDLGTVDAPKLVDVETIRVNFRRDYIIRNENIVAGHKLCRRCNGTGNQLYSMWQECQACHGSGVSRGNEDQFED